MPSRSGLSVKIAHLTRSTRSAASFFLGGIALAALTFVCLQLQLSLAGSALLYLIVIVVASLAGGFVAAAGLSVVAVALLQYFMSEPRFSFHLADPINAVELLVFLTTAFIISRLVAKAHRREQETRLIMDAMPANVVVGSNPGSLDSYANQRFREYTGYSLEKLRSAGFDSILPPDDRTSY